ncbi:hypothetical protein G6F24_018063 [Rhizopus arrhizus]|nr:hypothetical protein G6F24_018063 [Rhizopus arrhizus]
MMRARSTWSTSWPSRMSTGLPMACRPTKTISVIKNTTTTACATRRSNQPVIARSPPAGPGPGVGRQPTRRRTPRVQRTLPYWRSTSRRPRGRTAPRCLEPGAWRRR